MKFDEVGKSWKWRAAKAGLSLPELSSASNVSISSINYATSGSGYPKLSTVQKIEEVLTARGCGITLTETNPF